MLFFKSPAWYGSPHQSQRGVFFFVGQLRNELPANLPRNRPYRDCQRTPLVHLSMRRKATVANSGAYDLKETAADRANVMAIVFAISGLPPLVLTAARTKLPSVAFEKRPPRSVPQKRDLEFR